MFDSSSKIKLVLFIDALLFLICIAGIVCIKQKASLPFAIKGQDSYLTINIQRDGQHIIYPPDKLLFVDGKKVSSTEAVEFITDMKHIGQHVKISILTLSGMEELDVELKNSYSVYYIISTTFVAFFFFAIAIFILVKKPELPAARIFHWASIGIALMMCLTWANLNTFSFFSKYVLRNMLHILYTITPALFLHFTLVFPRDKSVRWKKPLFGFYTAGLILSIFNIYFYTSAIAELNEQNINNYLLFFNFFRVYLSITVLLSIFVFILALSKEKGKTERKQLKWLLFGFVAGPLTFVLIWVLPILLAGNPLVPEELVLILLCFVPITFAISIIKYHLLDIDEVINRSVVYGIVISILLIIYSLIILVFVTLLHKADQSIVSAIAAILLALIFQPIKARVQKFVDRKFFRVQYNFRKELNRVISEIKNHNDINSLGEHLISEINKLVPVEKIAFGELDPITGRLSIKAHLNFDPIAARTFTINSKILERKWFQIAAIKNKVEPGADVSDVYQNILMRWKISLVVPVKSINEELFGFIILGNKKSASRFTIEDIDLLRDIGTNAGATIERIRLQEQLFREQMEAERLEELNQQKSMFVSTVSHELKTPLTSIKIFAEMLRQNETEISDKSRNHLEIIEGESDRLTRLINNVLDFSKIEKGVKQYYLREVHLNKIVKNVIEIVKYPVKMKGFNLSTEIKDFNDFIRGDEDAITEAIENLISNSIRFSTSAKEIIISTFENNNFACVSVRDYGIGIEQKDLTKIFDQFYRSDHAKSKNIDGTGLGLPIVKHIVEAHHGKILVESSLNDGSKFTLCFPKLIKGEDNEENFNH